MTSTVTNDYGLASSQFDTFTSVELLSGDTPQVSTTSEAVASALLTAGLPAYSVVGRNVSGELVLAIRGSVDPADDIAPIGITVAPVAAGSSAGGMVPVYRTGCFNPDALNWGASYTTDEQKRLAFEGTGADILIKKNPSV